MSLLQLEPTKTNEAPQVLQALSTPIASVNKAAMDWYIVRVQKGRRGPFAELVDLTKERAELLLAVNEANRNLSSRRLSEITRDLVTGNYELNGETVIISKDGLMNDGQHRCSAVVNTGVTMQTFMVFGIERDTRRTVDTGTVRTSGNFIAMEGGKDVNQAAAVSLWLLLHSRNYMSIGISNPQNPTKAEVVAYYLQNSAEIDDGIRFVSRKEGKELRSKTALAVGYILAHRISPKAADEFFGKLIDGAGYDKPSALHATRRRLIDTLSMRMRPGEKLTIIISGWNAWRRGETPRTIQVRDTYPKMAK